MDLELNEKIYAHDEAIAAKTRAFFQEHNTLSINILGAPGAGKTSTLIRLIEQMNDLQWHVLEADIETDIDTVTLQKMGVETRQINTHGACHIEAPEVRDLLSQFRFDRPGIFAIENIGNLVCPAEFIIGEHLKILIVSPTDGSDKPYKYPLAFEVADLVIMNKSDLSAYVPFDEAFFLKGLRAINPTVPFLKVSAFRNEGMEEVAQFLRQKFQELIQGC